MRLALGAAACWLLVALPAAAQDSTRVIHTPWLALRFEQDGQEAPLVYRDQLLTEVQLRRAPFTIVLPMRGQGDVYWLAARADEAIFGEADADARRSARDRPPAAPYFGVGTGLADTAASSGTLMLDPDGHHHLYGLRLGPDLDRHVFFVSEVSRRTEVSGIITLPLEELNTPLHLVAWFDEDGDGVMHHGEYEFITLQFDRRSRR